MPGPVDAPRPEPFVPPLPVGDGPSAPHADPAPTAPLDVQLVRLDPGLPPPSYARPGDAGADLRTAADVRLEPGERAVVGTGVAIALPDGYAGFVHPRSGLAARAGLSVVNAPGTVDAGYRGEIRVCLVNHDPREAVELRRGDRIAQLVVQRVERVRFVEVAELPASERGAGGHGSTGGHAWLAPAVEVADVTDVTDISEDAEDAVRGAVPGDPMDAQAVPMDLAAGSGPRPGGSR
ncbi:dUTP diphosphatase [Pseudonocardia sp. S2-4]|uniref:Deoxyuridine 5'-triphosphate nucleotidohydrolase n=1 Tax=Pseudonocardia humida TaxID=2800819 RepID=A0ABT1A401_9PSEU|nr:dUTP diphosphatase [Pseudonocardia humida]